MLRLRRAPAAVALVLVVIPLGAGTAAAQASPDASGALAPPAQAASPVLRLVASASPRAHPPIALGAALREALAHGLRALCVEPALSDALPSTCALAARGAPALAELRAAALSDALAWRSRLALQAAAGSAELRRDVAVLSVALGGGSPAQLAAALHAAAEHAAPCAGPAQESCIAQRATVRDELTAALSRLPASDATASGTALVGVLAEHAARLFEPAAGGVLVARPSARVVALAQALSDGDLTGAFAVLPAFGVATPEVASPIPLARVADAIALLEARDADELRRRLLAMVVDVPTWADGLVLDLTVGVPVLESGRFQLVGDLTVGYRFRQAGFRLRGSVVESEVDQPDVFWDLHRWRGGAAGFYGFELERVELEVGGSSDVLLYDSTFTPFDLAPGEFLDENSLLVRGSAYGRVRVAPASGVVLRAALGFGLQFEDYDRVTNLSGAPEFIRMQHNVDLQAELALLVAWEAWPSVLRLRLSSETSSFSRTVNRVAVADARDPDVRRSSETLVEIDNDTRLLFDIAAAELGGFVPELHVQLDTVQLIGAAASQGVVTVAFGVGISRVRL